MKSRRSCMREATSSWSQGDADRSTPCAAQRAAATGSRDGGCSGVDMTEASKVSKLNAQELIGQCSCGQAVGGSILTKCDSSCSKGWQHHPSFSDLVASGAGCPAGALFAADGPRPLCAKTASLLLPSPARAASPAPCLCLLRPPYAKRVAAPASRTLLHWTCASPRRPMHGHGLI